MKIKKQISIKKIVSDIRNGVSDSQLIDKYRISAKGLQSVFRKLVAARELSPEELRHRMQNYDDTGTLEFDTLQFTPGQTLTCLVTVHDSLSPEFRGSICEVTDDGFMITGMESRTGDTRKLTVATDDFFPIDAFTVEAMCKWARNDGPEDSWIAAFEISKVSEDDKGKLSELARLVKLQFLG
jgi:hypothetical protein